MGDWIYPVGLFVLFFYPLAVGIIFRNCYNQMKNWQSCLLAVSAFVVITLMAPLGNPENVVMIGFIGLIVGGVVQDILKFVKEKIASWLLVFMVIYIAIGIGYYIYQRQFKFELSHLILFFFASLFIWLGWEGICKIWRVHTDNRQVSSQT